MKLGNNFVERNLVYRILRNLHLSDGGSYHVQMELKHGVDEDQAEQVIKDLKQAELIYEVEGTDPQLYDVNYSIMSEVWMQLWEEEIGEVSRLPANFETFMNHYSKAYMDDVDNSNIHEMMVTEFYFGLVHESDFMLPKSFQELRSDLEERYGGRLHSSKIIEEALSR